LQAPLPELFNLGLIVQLESKLNLPRIIWSIASRSNFAKGRAGEVARIWDRCDSVTAEVRCVEVRVIEDVEELSPELQRETLAELHDLES
jgi:hypothetical protein